MTHRLARGSRPWPSLPRPHRAMTRATFRKADLRRAVEAVTAAGQIVARVEVDPNGKIVIVTAGEAQNSTPLDTWMAQHGSRQA
jgi:hypothetical protein